MGFCKRDLRFLLSAYKLGLNSGSVLTLGRQNLFIRPSKVLRMFREYGQSSEIASNKAIYYADDVFESLGFQRIDSIDASTYEGATIIHDMNIPVPESLHCCYDLVWDGGTLEHIFNFPTALMSAMQMVKVGGHLIFVTPSNNQCGHGFYQFSPELFFRVLTPENGFELIRIYVTGKGGPYHISDPALVGGRVELLNSEGVYIMAHARKTRNTEIFAKSPQQSDYVTTWSATAKQDSNLKAFLRRILLPSQVSAISRFLNTLRQKKIIYNWRKKSNLSNRNFFIPVTRWDEVSPCCNANKQATI